MMHKMGDLQSKYDGKDVQIISVCVEDLDTVEDFLEMETFGPSDEKGMTTTSLQDESSVSELSLLEKPG